MVLFHRVKKDASLPLIFRHPLPDGQGKEAKFVIWSHPGNDVTGLLARSEKVVNTSEKVTRTAYTYYIFIFLLGGGEAYHYHTKLIRKDAFTGGAHLWHQDYGYWYKNGCLFPDMLTVFVAIDKCTKSNGCLQVRVLNQKMTSAKCT
ncbi:hypothetical protein KUTeg_022846 [Tegillarca granosa]|uniref:Uncharacterized protein n=1 Tax=Tegillarca granosa TaxID=220873 RepID=A0ABQ9E322_TEGGR|nr:hypothetical protein KUTeg_022846 [Tegillarca granosa]